MNYIEIKAEELREPRDRNSVQNGTLYRLTDQDILQLYAYMTPKEIIETFRKPRCRTEKTMYALIKKYKLDRPFAAKKYLRSRILNDIPDNYSLENWEKEAPELIEIAKAEMVAGIWKRIRKHESFWDE